jgi:bifunctional non-homologous end joining protein LigD
MSGLAVYRQKRDFAASPEPAGKLTHRPRLALRFVVQRHDARQLHFDFRLELEGALKSWAVPKGPSMNPGVKRLAVHVEDHPLEYAAFAGEIPAGHYGAGTVAIWDEGTWQPAGTLAQARRDYAAGHLKFELHGKKLHGHWVLIRTHLPAARGKENWLLIKERDPQPPVRTPRQPRRKTPPLAEGVPVPALPAHLQPELASLATAPPPGEWSYEVKFDGYRVLARVEGKKIQLFTRNGHDWTAKFPQQVKALAQLGTQNAWLDGEAVVLDKDGVPNFQLLQNAFEAGTHNDIVLFLFDAPFLDGRDLRHVALRDRRAWLQAVVKASPLPPDGPVRFSQTLDGSPDSLLASARTLGLEGLIAKRAESPYLCRRTTDWQKLKCRQRQEFVVGGYTEPAGSRGHFGALLLGVYEGTQLRYAGKVGTGFDASALGRIQKTLALHERSNSPFAPPQPARMPAKIHWLEPKLVAECHFADWTAGGQVRQAAFIALRTDKPAHAVRREQPLQEEQPMHVQVTHPERVIDRASQLRKGDLVAYYSDIADRLLPHLRDRPVALVRAPDGVNGATFFQKHAEKRQIPGSTRHAGLDPGHPPLLSLDTQDALLGAAQMNALEFHTWNALVDRIEAPDRFVLDLDPGENLPWRHMQDGAQLVHALLTELGLQAFCKTSGSKGLHIVVPLRRSADWQTVFDFSKAIATHLAQTLPAQFSAKMGPQNRKGKLFVDYLRNRRGATCVAAYSARAKAGLGVSTPIAWEELADVAAGDQWTVQTVRERLQHQRRDPWHAWATCQQQITQAMRQKLEAE